MSKDGFRMGKAYQRVDLFDEEDRNVMVTEKGAR